MGFKFKKIYVTGGDSDFQIGDTDALRRSRSETIISKCAQAIIDCNVGWVMDSTKSSTTTSFVDIPTIGGNLVYPGLFLINNNSGCKLFIAYFAGKTDNTYSIKRYDNGNSLYGYGQKNYVGLCASIIPSGSASTFGDPTSDSFIPSDATRIISNVFYYEPNSSYFRTYGGNPMSGYIYCWGLFVTDSTIAISSNKSTNGVVPDMRVVPAFVTGKIFGVLAHREDKAINSKYGVVIFRDGVTQSDQNEGESPLYKTVISNIFGQSGAVYLPWSQMDSYIYDYPLASIAKADGTWMNNNSYSGSSLDQGVVYVADYGQLCGYMHAGSGQINGSSRWVPFNVAALNQQMSDSFGIVQGDGYKGFLDTDLFRCARGLSGQMYAGGMFICLEDYYCMLIGWDSTNEL